MQKHRKAKAEKHRLNRLPHVTDLDAAWERFRKFRGNGLIYYGPERSTFADDAVGYAEFERQRAKNAGMGDGCFTLSVLLEGREFIMECNFGD